jgi:hypothetical protein
VQLDLVGRVKLNGAATVKNNYFLNYLHANDWHLTLGIVEDRLAILINDPSAELSEPAYSC